MNELSTSLVKSMTFALHKSLRFIGGLISKLVLTLIFFLVVFPIGLIRRILGTDLLRLREFKKSNDSVLINRNHEYSIDDLKRPY